MLLYSKKKPHKFRLFLMVISLFTDLLRFFKAKVRHVKCNILELSSAFVISTHRV